MLLSGSMVGAGSRKSELPERTSLQVEVGYSFGCMIDPVQPHPVHASSAQSILVWRDEGTFEGKKDTDQVISGRILSEQSWSANITAPTEYEGYLLDCPFCRTRYESQAAGEPLDHCVVERFCEWGELESSKRIDGLCLRCGFWHRTALDEIRQADRVTDLVLSYIAVTRSRVAVLRELDINDGQLVFAELATHLTRKFSDIHALHPRKFEELVRDIYKGIGYEVTLTQQSRDGGCDLILLDKTGGPPAIVECKRYAASNKVDVCTVRKLLGVAVLEGYQSAKIVTSSYFTSPAQGTIEKLKERNSSITLELVDADRLLSQLEIFRIGLPDPSLRGLVYGHAV